MSTRSRSQGFDAVRLALPPATEVVATARRLPRRARAFAGALAGRAMLAVVDAVVASPYAERALDHVLESRLAEHAVESPGMERMVAQVIESRLLDEVVARLLECEELWILVDEIAESPAVTAAITQQSLGFADEIADDINQRTRRADAIAERAARRLLRRGARVGAP
jgi:hypothetical protein